MFKFINFLLPYILLVANCAHAESLHSIASCEQDSSLQAKISEELLKIAKEDQEGRSVPFESINWNKLNHRDLQRRIRVAEIFALGCFQVVSDYVSAATVYQHGTTGDHFYQSFVWSLKALKLGGASQRWWVAAALDRYLVKIGHKQLFGTQLAQNAEGKWCIQAVERSFPNSTRIEYVKYSVQDQIAHTLKGIGSNQSPKDVKNCPLPLKDSPKGTVPGFW